MADDELREGSQSSILDTVESVGEAALAIGAGAALFYRHGGADLLSTGFSKASRFLHDAHSEISQRAFSENAGSLYRRLISDQDSIWNRASQAIEDEGPKLRLDNNNNLIGFLHRIHNISANGLAERMFSGDVANQVYREFGQQFVDNPVISTKIDSFIGKTINKYADPDALKIAKEVFTEDELQQVPVNNILKRLNELHNNAESWDSFRENTNRTLENIKRICSDNMDDIEETFGSVNKPTFRQKLINNITGDDGVTIGEAISRKDEFIDSKVSRRGEHGTSVIEDAISFLEDFRENLSPEQQEKFNNLYVDFDVLRKGADGEIRSFKDAANSWDKALDYMAGTLPGTLFKLRDIQYMNRAPKFSFFTAHTGDDLIARIAEGSDGSVISNNYVFMLGKTYRIGQNGTLEHIESLDDSYLKSGRYGTLAHLQKAMFGNRAFRPHTDPYRQLFDIGLDGESNIFESLFTRFNKFADPEWRGNVLNDFLDDNRRSKLMTDPEEYLNAARELNDFFSKNTYGMDKKTAIELKKHVRTNSMESNILEKMVEGKEELLDYLIGRSGSSMGHIDRYKNKDLVSFLYKYLDDSQGAMQNINIKADRTMFFGGNETADFWDILRTEASKEVFLQHAGNNTANAVDNLDAMVDLIEKTELSPRSKEETKRLAYWAGLQAKSGLSARANRTTHESKQWINDIVNEVDDLMSAPKAGEKNGRFKTDLRETLRKMSNEKISARESTRVKNPFVVQEQYYNRYVLMKRAVNPLDLIASINQGTFSKTATKFVKQFFAGRHDPENVTTATFLPYFMAERLSAALNTAGVGLSNYSTGSAHSIMSGLMLKRVLPLAVGFTYLDYLDDESREITGTSLGTAFLSGAANIDLAARRVFDATGLSGVIRNEKSINPLLEYWFDKDPFQSYEERKEYYENGYDPVRKGRWWNFGSVNELRGGQIEYWKPNELRLATSGYKDKALYGDIDTKWSHSLLPTPTHPLSPLMYILDPYYLEEMHSEDRPYPVTGQMFEEGTPWGLVLNPTVGELIKPQKRMHEDRLGGTGTDVMRLIEERNNETYRRADEYLIKWKNNEPQLVDYTAYNAPEPDEQIATVETENGNVTGIRTAEYGEYPEGASPKEMITLAESAKGMGIPTHLLSTVGKNNVGLTLEDELVIDDKAGGILSRIGRDILTRAKPLTQVGAINAGIMRKAMFREDGGILTPEAVHLTTGKIGRQMQLLDNDDAVADMLYASSGDEYVHEMAMSARNLAGIYGWGLHQVTGFGDNNEKFIATSQDMTSFSRAFWDQSFGGFGGEVNEIGRRFFQEFRRSARVNPLKNTQDDWLPEKFQYGDPYTSIPLGEARLPGTGYEAIYELHPDQFGQYGAFDRMKILADVAPQSSEYRIWAAIASKTVSDPDLRKEMKNIKKRRSAAAKQHDFYDYKFLGRGLDYTSSTITEVIDNNHFKVQGDKKVYRLAGVRVLNGPDNKPTLNKFLHPGMEVTMAVDENPYYRSNNDPEHTVNAAVYVKGENLAQQLMEQGLAKERKGDTSAAATMGKYGPLRQFEGKMWEAISHIDVPFLSDKFARIRSPLESYKAEQVYGTPYQSWSDVTGTYIYPAFERAISDDKGVLWGAAAYGLSKYVESLPSVANKYRFATNAALMLSNRGAFIGGMMGYVLRMKGGKTVKTLAELGSLASFAGYVYTRIDKPVETSVAFSTMGLAAAHMLRKNKVVGALTGLAVGLGISSGNYSILNGKSDKAWIPERTLKKWDIQEYFDRLTYIKFMGLYEQAAQKAEDEEGVDIKHLIDLYSESAEEKKELKHELEKTKEKVKAIFPEWDDTRKRLVSQINNKLEDIAGAEMVMKAGPWTHAALLYRQAAKSTLYGADEDAAWMDLIRALPKNERDYFLEFVKERDPKKRNEILKYASPYISRALKIAWGQKPEEMESNEEYFERHNLPNLFWAGWRPDVDLKNVEVKTIANEGMLLADFGFYESQLRDPNVVNAPNLSPNSNDDPLTVRANLVTTLRGLGLTGVDISVEPQEKNGVDVVFDYMRIVDYNVHQAVDKVFKYM